MPKNAFQKYDVITFTCFFAIAQQTTKILFWNFACVLFVSRSHIFRFLDKLKNCILYAIIFDKLYFWILRVKIEKYKKIRDGHFVERSILRRLAYFFIASHFKIEHSSSLQTFAIFWRKIVKHDVTKTQFSQKCLDECFWKFGYIRHINAGEGTDSFASISAAVFELSRKPGRGAEFAPPPGSAC